MLHKTDAIRDAYESADGDNTYLWEIVANVSAVVDEVPSGIESNFDYASTVSLASTTIYNAWPERINNASIFPYLNQDGTQAHPEFSTFIKNWYQSACAIVYKNGVINKIIGSGILVTNTDIATARHNFNNIPDDNLYIRFFHYKVTNSSNSRYLHVRERQLDIPVIAKKNAKHGVDGGLLIIPSLQNTNIFKRYAKVITALFSQFDAALPSGDYAMFHFSGGRPQISIGEIQVSSFGAELHDNTFIQGGPGASGAGLIWKSFDSVSAVGISIYRFMNEGNLQRRIIQFSQFINGVFSDGISDPYRNNPSFKMIPVNAFNESGYEFLRYRFETHVGRRVDSPVDNAYHVNLAHSNHHIIPIGDLLYLWDYFHTLDENTVEQIRLQVNSKCGEFKKRRIQALNREINEFYPTERLQKWEDGIRDINQAVEIFKSESFDKLYREDLSQKYCVFYNTLLNLCPNKRFDRTWFAWSFWNLFKGWEKNYRVDDPADGCSRDFSEKRRPKSFSPLLWNCIKNPETGLHRRIQQLKATTEINASHETILFSCMDTLAKEWSKRSLDQKTIHPYKAEEWERMGQKDGHEVYQVKP